MVDVSKLDVLVQDFNRSDAPGLVIGVSHRGSMIYRRALGLACVQGARANTISTRMRIGSTSKHFTCLAALLLAEEGKLDVDAPAARYLPELPSTEGMPTLRNFMNHTSGYRCSLELATIANGQALPPKDWTLQALARQRGANFQPNRGQTYCNGGYHLLSLAIERAAGMAFEEVLKTRIFEPLGMHDTIGVQSDHQLVPGAATLHLVDPAGGWRRGFFPTEQVRGEGNMISTIDDMLRWLAHLNGEKRIGSAETWRQMLETPTLENGFKTIYSLGLMNYAYRGVHVIAHSGSVIGGNSEMITVPAHELSIVILVNGALVSANALAKKFIDVILGDVLTAPSVIADAARFGHLHGTHYQGASGLRLGFERAGESMGVSFLGYPALPILRVDGDALCAPFQDVALGPLTLDARALSPDETGAAPQRITLTESGYPEELMLLAPLTPEQALSACEGLVGHYASFDLNARAEVRRDGEDYVLFIQGEYSAKRPLRLAALSADAFTAKDDSASVAVLAQREAGEVVGLQFDSVRARHLMFSRIAA